MDGIITSWNKGAELIFGFSAAEAVGRSIEIIIPPERRAEEREILRRLGLGETVEHFETERLRKGGGRIKVSLRISPIWDVTGRVIGASKIARDITDRIRREEILTRTVRTLEALYNLVGQSGHSNSPSEIGEAALDAIQAAVVADRASVRVRRDGVLPWCPRTLSDEYLSCRRARLRGAAIRKAPEALCFERGSNDSG